MRLFHTQGITILSREIKRSEQEAIDTGDGIDIAIWNYPRWTQLVMGLDSKIPGTMNFSRKILIRSWI